MLLRAAKHFAAMLAVVLLSGAIGATLVRYAPGFGADERTLDPRLNSSSMDALRAERDRDRDIAGFYANYLLGILRGDLGTSRTLNRPVVELLRHRGPATLVSLLAGLAGGWVFGFGVAMLLSWMRSPRAELLAGVVSGSLLCVPAAMLGIGLLLLRAPGQIAIALIVFPQVFRFARNLMIESESLPHVITAHVKGLTRLRILFAHMLPPAAPQLLLLAGVSVSMAVGAIVPVEVVCDIPGVGQLAWSAAMARDLPMLVNVTMLVALVTLAANGSADLAANALRQGQR